VNFVDEAKTRWPAANILGSGRYAVVAQKGGLIYLATTEQQQRSIALGVDCPQFVDLVPIDFDKIRDLYDPEEARRERREKKAERFNARY